MRRMQSAKESDITLMVLGSHGKFRAGQEGPQQKTLRQLPPKGLPPSCLEEDECYLLSGALRAGMQPCALTRTPVMPGGPGGPILAHQSLLALLATLTIRPWVTPVPLGGKGMRRREREKE